MCGIVGVVSKLQNGFTNRDQNVFQQLLYADTLRGDDSTGVMMVENDGSVNVAKEASTAEQFLWDKEWSNLDSKAFRTGAAMVGHNRKATRGSVTDENAHPFIVDNDIVLLHNGSMRGDHKKFADVEVDSHAIAHVIHKHNGDVEKALNELQNTAYALVWYCVSKKELNFVRNSERPLHILENGSSWFFASEGKMLEWIVDRNTNGVMNDKAVLIPEHTLVQFTLQGRSWTKKEHKLDIKPPVTQSYFPQQQQHQRRSPCHDTHSSWYGRRQNDDDLSAYYRQLAGDTDAVFGGPVQQAANEVANEGVSVRGRFTQGVRIKPYEGEEERAIREDMTITSEDFFKELDSVPFGGWERGIPFDYAYKKNSGGDMEGVFVYAMLGRNKDITIRVYESAPNMKEEDVDKKFLDICTSGHPYQFRCEARQWTKIADNPLVNSSHGYGMIYSQDYAKVHTATTEVTDGDIDNEAYTC